MIEIDKQEILRKKQTLEACNAYLKGEFIGIDAIIDSLLDYLSIWYLMPEILTRPVIINLWGMTGVGKTDLVRKTVKFLHYQDRFTEVELSNTEQTTWGNTVSHLLSNNGLNDGKPAIVLFDEIQRFNTLNSDGEPLPQSKYSDFWELLSDGRLSRKSKDDLDTYLYNYLSNKRRADEAHARGEATGTEKPRLEIWDARTLQATLNLDIDLMDLTQMHEEDMIALIQEAKEKKEIYEPVDHSQTLIIISGNLDDAFDMSGQTSEADVDADIYHAFTEKITLVDIKNALTRKFRPEQVARFGNIHLIYNSLRRTDFEQLIVKEVGRIKKDMRDKFGIEVEVTPAVRKLIYRNGVFPVQGVRPVFSSIIDILESNLSKFVFTAVMEGHDKIGIDYDWDKQQLLATIGSEQQRIDYVGRIDKIRESNEADVVANISVHEAGHAVVYLVLTGMVPLQLKSKVASSYAGGFTFPHQIHTTKASLLDKVRVYLAGGLAEEIIFGDEHASVGRRDDRDRATEMVVEYVRHYGFTEQFQTVYNLQAGYLLMNMDPTDETIERIMRDMVVDTRRLLNEHRELLLELSRTLAKVGSLEAEEIREIAGRHGVQATVEEEGHLWVEGYAGRLGG